MSFARSVSERLDRIAPGRLGAAIAAATVLLFLGLIRHDHYAASGDAVHYLVISHSVAYDADFDVANDYADPNRPMKDPPERHALPGRNGVLRPVHDVGWPVLAAPFVRVASAVASSPIAFRQWISVLMIAVTAALALAFFSASSRLTGMTAAAAASALLWVLSPPVLTHGYIFLTEIPTALIALTIYLRLDRVRSGGARSAVLLGFLSGLLLLIHVRNVGLVLVFSFLALWRLTGASSSRRAFVAALAAMFAIKLALNWLFWGTLLTTPHEHFAGWPGFPTLLFETATRIGGLLFDARHGLLWSAPIYLLAPAALILLRRQSRGASNELSLIVVAYLFFVINPITNFHGWRGGWSPAARFLVPIAPFLLMALPLLVRSRLGVIVTAAVATVQIVISAFQWANPVLTFSEGPGSALWIQRLAGSSVADAIPAWEPLTPMLAAAGVAAIVVWVVLTRIVTRAPEWRRS